jgi:hypothetical protein
MLYTITDMRRANNNSVGHPGQVWGKIKAHFILFLLSLLLHHNTFSQSEILIQDLNNSLNNYRKSLLVNKKFGYSISASLSVEFGKANNSQYRLSLGGGLIKTLNYQDSYTDITPFTSAFQTELLIYKGGLGSSQSIDERSNIHVELRNQFLLSAGYASFDNGAFAHVSNGAPLSIFSGNSALPLIDPYDFSVTIGSTFVNSFTDEYKQQIGGLTSTYRGFQINYCNEGPFFRSQIMPTGDGYDRWWTGGGHIGYFNLGSTALVSKVQISYDKFTGWQPFCYELASRLGIHNTPYKDLKESLLNQGRYMFSATLNDNFSFGVGIYEPRYLDVQNIIHTLIKTPFHQTQLNKRVSGLWSYRFINLGTL